MNSKKIFLLLFGLLFLFGFNVFTVNAADFRFSKQQANVTVHSGETVKNLYAAGNIILIDGEVQKDLYAAGNIITVGGPVENNVFAAGSTVVLKNEVGGNAHLAGGSVVVEDAIGGDLFVGGGNVLVSEGAKIEGDLVVGGGVVDVRGEVVGKVLIGGGEVTINGVINGPMEIRAEDVKIGGSAEIKQYFKYKAPKEAEIQEGAIIAGAVDFEQISTKQVEKVNFLAAIFGIFSVMFFVKFLISVAVGLVFVYFFGNLVKNVVREGFGNFWANLAIGFAVLVLVPVIGVILVVTVIGAYLAGIIALLYFLALMISSVIANIAFGSWLMKTVKKKDKYKVRWQEVLLGVVSLKIVCLIPFLGWLVCFAFFLISLGSMSVLLGHLVSKNRA